MGYGLLGTTTTQNVQALSSFHAGLELELAQNFSIAVTLVLRRTQGLLEQYRVGSPVTAGMTAQDVVGDAWQPGLGIVINTSPSFLQFAIPSGGGGGSQNGATGSSGHGAQPDAGTDSGSHGEGERHDVSFDIGVRGSGARGGDRGDRRMRR